MGNGMSVGTLKKAKRNPADAEANRLWSDMDTDDGGTLTVKEIMEALKKNHPDYTATKTKAAVDHFDKDKDGKISREEVRRHNLSPLRPYRPLTIMPCPVSVHRGAVCSGDQHRACQARPEGTQAPVDDQDPSAGSRG